MECYKFNFSTMGCPASLKIYTSSQGEAQRVFDLVQGEVERLNMKYSNYTPHSYIAEINRSAGKKEGIIVDEETAGLLDYSQACTELSGGLFDITAGILFRAWNFDVDEPRYPTQKELSFYMDRVGWHKVIWQRPHLILPVRGMTLDFGGVVKEYAVDRVVALCYEQGIHHGLIEIGGDLAVIGPRPNGDPWLIGVQNPFDPDQHLFTFELSKGGVATSGDYARYIEIEGERYCHILNPLTGMAIRSVGSVTVVASPCLVAGSSSTIAFLLAEKGVAWLKEQDIPFAHVGRTGEIVFQGMKPNLCQETSLKNSVVIH